jgi:hypothetical protein
MGQRMQQFHSELRAQVYVVTDRRHITINKWDGPDC